MKEWKKMMLKKTSYIFIIVISFVLITYLVITYLSANPKYIKKEYTKECLFEEELKADNASLIEVIEKEYDDRSIFCTLTDKGIMVIEFEPIDDSNWRKSALFYIDNSVLNEFLSDDRIFMDTVYRDDTIFIYGVCNPELNIRKIRFKSSRGKIYECSLAKNNRLFFIKTEEESALGMTVQGFDDKDKVVFEYDRLKY